MGKIHYLWKPMGSWYGHASQGYVGSLNSASLLSSLQHVLRVAWTGFSSP
ncbi:hypothetical protein GN958_ATG11551 [Phytophthora infestans]|uniref:Uncharacterized protein n=1 Tax=Phytophthora infestans TaxID=4787 RepID=A0A8S9UEM0_PHYIN|nr:hypothetical protein GN958_ATG11551 [Phytophthora infestans]